MVSFQFRQGINAKILARHQNGTIKHFKFETKHQKSKTLTYEFSQCDFNIKRQILEL